MRVARHEMPGKLANMIRPGANGMIRGIAACSAPTMQYPFGTPSYRTLRDGSELGRIPGNELPGYHHPVPTGQELRPSYI